MVDQLTVCLENAWNPELARLCSDVGILPEESKQVIAERLLSRLRGFNFNSSKFTPHEYDSLLVELKEWKLGMDAQRKRDQIVMDHADNGFRLVIPDQPDLNPLDSAREASKRFDAYLNSMPLARRRLLKASDNWRSIVFKEMHARGLVFLPNDVLEKIEAESIDTSALIKSYFRSKVTKGKYNRFQVYWGDNFRVKCPSKRECKRVVGE